MKRSRFSEEQIIGILKEQEASAIKRMRNAHRSEPAPADFIEISQHKNFRA